MVLRVLYRIYVLFEHLKAIYWHVVEVFDEFQSVSHTSSFLQLNCWLQTNCQNWHAWHCIWCMRKNKGRSLSGIHTSRSLIVSEVGVSWQWNHPFYGQNLSCHILQAVPQRYHPPSLFWLKINITTILLRFAHFLFFSCLIFSNIVRLNFWGYDLGRNPWKGWRN